METYKYLSQSYASLEDFENAYRYSKQYIEMNDSLQTLQAKEMLNYLNNKQGLLLTDNDSTGKKNNDISKKSDNGYATGSLILMYTCFMLLCAFLLILVLYLKEKKKKA
jgi:hypothetical protein